MTTFTGETAEDERLETMRDQLQHIERMADVALNGFGVMTPEGVLDALIDARAAMRAALDLLDQFALVGEPS